MKRLDRLKGRYWRTRYRTVNALRDACDRWLRGYCCAMPITFEDGGYHFWRCGLKCGHKGPHRSINYLWGHDGGSSYSPVSPAPPRLDRYPSLTRRQRRWRDEWHRQRDRERRMSLAGTTRDEETG